MAKAAVESAGDPQVSTNTALVLNRERRALLLISLWNGEACGWVRQGIIEQLGGANA